MRPPSWWLLALLLTGLLVRAVPLFLPTYIDPDHFYHERIAQAVVNQQGTPSWDALSYGGRPQTYYPFYHVLLAVPSFLLGVDLRSAYALSSLLLGLAGMLAFYSLAKNLLGEKTALASLLFFAVTPLAFVRATAFSRPDGFALSLLALLALFIYKRKLLSVALLGLSLALADLPGAVFGAGLFAVWAFLGRGKKLARNAALVGVSFLVLGLLYYLFLPWASFQLSSVTLSSEEVSSLNVLSIFGFGGAAWLFVALGLWELRRSFSRFPAWLWAWLLLGVLALAVAIRNLSFAALPVCLFAGAGLFEAARKTKQYSKWLVALVIVALSIQATLYYATLDPLASPGFMDSLHWARANTAENSTFLSLWDRGHVITGVAGRRVVMDGYFEFAPQADERYSDIISFFHGGEANARRIMQKWNATHVLLDSRMPALFPSSNLSNRIRGWSSFENLFDNGVVQIYRLRS